MSDVSKLLWAERLAQVKARRAGPEDGVGTGAPGDQVAFEIETAGTVLLRSEICMCFTPSLVYELTCASHLTSGLGPAIPLL